MSVILGISVVGLKNEKNWQGVFLQLTPNIKNGKMRIVESEYRKGPWGFDQTVS